MPSKMDDYQTLVQFGIFYDRPLNLNQTELSDALCSLHDHTRMLYPSNCHPYAITNSPNACRMQRLAEMINHHLTSASKHEHQCKLADFELEIQDTIQAIGYVSLPSLHTFAPPSPKLNHFSPVQSHPSCLTLSFSLLAN